MIVKCRVLSFVVSLKLEQAKKTVKVSCKFKVNAPMCISSAIGDVNMKPEELQANILHVFNFVLSLTPKGLQNFKRVHIKSTMGPTFTIYGVTRML